MIASLQNNKHLVFAHLWDAFQFALIIFLRMYLYIEPNNFQLLDSYSCDDF